VRTELSVADSRAVLLARGALVRRKGIEVLLEALPRMTAARATWTLRVAGDGPERANLERRATELGLAEQVRFLGRRDDAVELLNACDVLVMPSRREGLGVAALEAMASKRAVVASNVGGLGQTVVHGETGVLVPPDDADELARALDRVVRHAAVRALFGRQGRARVESGFDAARMVEQYEALYREVLAEAAR